jgi:cyclopropane-fatty-acyl-phospholipid synthase
MSDLRTDAHAVPPVERHPDAEGSASGARAARFTKAALSELFGPPASRSFAVRLWDGTVEPPGGGAAPGFTLVLSEPGALRRMIVPPSELSIVEAYLSGAIDVEGDLEAASDLADEIGRRLRSARTLARLLPHVLALPAGGPAGADGDPRRRRFRFAGRRHSQNRDAAAIRYHYDVGNEFFGLFLDRRLVYSCAYFPTGTEDIDAAQTAKLEHICRKLRLQRDERMLDIGCGWGGLMLHAAERYGVHVLGITLSEPQAAFVRQRITASGLQDRCRVEVRDYRALPPDLQFDKVSSVGLVEHLGHAQLPTYFRAGLRLVKPGGLFLNHTLIRVAGGRPRTLVGRMAHRLWRRGQFVARYVFPDVEPLPLADIIQTAERTGFETRDVEQLRDHYVLTARQWVRRLEQRRDEAIALIGEHGYRVWRLYMAGGARNQRTGRDGIVQVLLAKPEVSGRTGLPLTRADLYRDEHA